MIIVDQSPLPRALAQALLERKHARPNLKVVVVSDPRSEMEGGTPIHYLASLESVGAIVARVRLERLRDPNPFYSSLWRLLFGWWDDPYEDRTGQLTLKMRLREHNGKQDERRILVADDGIGGWRSVLEMDAGESGIALYGGVARDIVAGELQVAQWSSDDDRLPAPPPPDRRALGSVDERWLTESAVRNALLDALGAARPGDHIGVLAGALGDRRIVDALKFAAARAAVRVLLDPSVADNRALAAELLQAGGKLELRWLSVPRGGSLAYVSHDADLWVCMGSTALTRRDTGDFNLSGNVELRLPAHAAMARASLADFDTAWSHAAPGAQYTDRSTLDYWRYRLSETIGLAGLQ